jgi:hypothetical protein
MSRFMIGLPGRVRGNPVQYFTYGPLEFDVSRAIVLASNRRKYRAEVCTRHRTGSARGSTPRTGTWAAAP